MKKIIVTTEYTVQRTFKLTVDDNIDLADHGIIEALICETECEVEDDYWESDEKISKITKDEEDGLSK